MTLQPDPFGLALWELYDAEREAKRARPAPSPDDFPAGTDAPIVITDPARYASSALENARRELGTYPQGERNTGLNAVAFGLGKLVGAELLTYEDAADFLWQQVDELWPDRDAHNVRGTIRSGLTGGMRQALQWVRGLPSALDPAAPFGVIEGEAATPALAASDAAPTENNAAGWLPTDLRPYLDGSYRPVLPTMMRRTDGTPGIYAGRVHWLSGEPESLKTWLALLACQQCLADGHRVVYIDLEDSPQGMVGRLQALGVADEVIESRFHYISPDGPLTPAAREAIGAIVGGSALVIIDAATEALSRQGLTPKDDVDVAAWLDMLPRWAVKLGPAVLVLDHVVKDTENRGRWATGSQHKLAGLDGVAYLVEPVMPGGRGKRGMSRVLVAKDRHGHLGPSVVMVKGGRRWFGDLIVDDTNAVGGFLEVVLQPADKARTEDADMPHRTMRRICEVLAEVGRELTSSEIGARVGGNAAERVRALAMLEDSGHVAITTGPRNAKLHRLVRPFGVVDGDET